MAYGITEEGFIIKPLSVIRQEVQDAIRVNIDAGLVLDDQSLLGQLEALFSDQIAGQWELAQTVYASQYPNSANGFSLDEGCAITGTERDDNTKTAGVGQVILNPYKTLPAGSVAHLTDQPGKRFVTLTEVVGIAAGYPDPGTDVTFQAEEGGATQVVPGQLSVIAEPVSGWTGVGNTSSFTTGTDREEDDELRARREDELEAQGSTNVDSIRADLLRVTGVVDATVFENVKDFTDPVTGLPAHSIHCVCRGGLSADVAQQIFDSKAAGIDTYGTESETITDTQGVSHEIFFDFADEIVTYIDVDITTDALEFDEVYGPPEIKTNIAAYVNALGVGDHVIIDQIKCSTFLTIGVKTIISTQLDTTADPSATIDMVIAIDEYATSDAGTAPLYADGNIRVYVNGVEQ